MFATHPTSSVARRTTAHRSFGGSNIEARVWVTILPGNRMDEPRALSITPVENIRLLEDPENTILVIMKDGKVYMNRVCALARCGTPPTDPTAA
jgi:hypothetical protein